MSDQFKVSMPVASIELQEFLFSETAARVAENCENTSKNVHDWGALKMHVRESFRFQRFAVMNWLMMNGVSIPPDLLSDSAHPLVGNQFPDRKSL